MTDGEEESGRVPKRTEKKRTTLADVSKTLASAIVMFEVCFGCVNELDFGFKLPASRFQAISLQGLELLNVLLRLNPCSHWRQFFRRPNPLPRIVRIDTLKVGVNSFDEAGGQSLKPIIYLRQYRGYPERHCHMQYDNCRRLCVLSNPIGAGTCD
jgi:hypothetical protein